MNYLKDIKELKNTYYIIRHGESIANVKRIIISKPEIGIKRFGLTEKGKKQVLNSIQEQEYKFDLIISSDFSRTRESAEIIKKHLNMKEITYDARLRERFFGDFDMKTVDYYHKHWSQERKTPHKMHDVETPEDVQTRTSSLIKELEDKYSDKKILLVSHGDPIRILESAFNKLSPYEYLDISMEKNAFIKKLKFKP